MIFDKPAELVLETERLFIVVPRFHIYYVDQITAMFEKNMDHFRDSMPTMSKEQFGPDVWQDKVVGMEADFKNGKCYAFLIISKQENYPVIGQITYDGIVQGIFKACYLGYRISSHWEGKGLMNESLEVTNNYIFSEVKLHRIMANYRPHNIRSAKLLHKLGFRVDGCAIDYLFLDGDWRDHILTSLVKSK